MIKLGLETDNYIKNNEMLIGFLRNRHIYINREKRISIDVHMSGETGEVIVEAIKGKKCLYKGVLNLTNDKREFVKCLLGIESKLRGL